MGGSNGMDASPPPDAPSEARTTGWGLVRLVRPGNALLSAVGVAIGALAAAGPAAIGADPWVLVLAALVGFLGTAYGNALNDLFDHQIDRTAHPRRPLPQGRVTRMAAWNLVLLLWLLTIIVAAWVDTAFLLLAVALLALLFVYERTLKGRGLMGNLAVATAAGALFPLGALAYAASLEVPLVLGLIAAFAHLGRELLKDAEDVAADRSVRQTFAVRFGPRAAARLGALFLVTAVVVSPLPHLTAGWSDLFLFLLLPVALLFMQAAVQGVRRPARGRAWAKAAMVAALVVFLVGGLT